MLFDYLSCCLGFIKLIIYKLFYFRRIHFKINSKIDVSSRFLMKRKSSIVIGSIRVRHNCLFRTESKGNITICDGCFFNDNCSIISAASIKIGEKSIFGPNVTIIDHDHDYKNDMNKLVSEPIVVGSNCWIGANCIILRGVKIGDNVVIGAGSFVNKDVPSNSIYYNKITPVIKER